MEKDKTAENLSAVYYGLNMLKMLRCMKLITEEEFDKIAQIIVEHYEAEVYYV